MQTKHFSQLIGMSALWGASFPLLRIASPALGPWVVAAARCVLASLVLALLMVALRQRWPSRRDWPALAALSMVSVVLPFVLFNWAALTLPAGYSAVLNATRRCSASSARHWRGKKGSLRAGWSAALSDSWAWRCWCG